MQTKAAKQRLFVAIARTSKRAFAGLHPHAPQAVAVAFLRGVPPRVPCKMHTLLTGNGIPCRNLPQPAASCPRGPSPRRRTLRRVGPRLTKPIHPWTNDPVERMNRTVKGATVKRFHCETTGQSPTHVQTFLRACDLAKRLKRLHGLTSYGFICAEWRKNLSIHPRPHAPSSGTQLNRTMGNDY